MSYFKLANTSRPHNENMANFASAVFGTHSEILAMTFDKILFRRSKPIHDYSL